MSSTKSTEWTSITTELTSTYESSQSSTDQLNPMTEPITTVKTSTPDDTTRPTVTESGTDQADQQTDGSSSSNERRIKRTSNTIPINNQSCGYKLICSKLLPTTFPVSNNTEMAKSYQRSTETPSKYQEKNICLL